MGKCVRHPDIDTDFICQKHQVYLCNQCLVCRDPQLYCRFRTACPIDFMQRSGETWAAEPSPGSESGDGTL